MHIFRFSLQTRDDYVVFGTSNSEYPRLNLHIKSWSQLKLEARLLLPFYSFNCSNIVSTLSVDHVCSVSLTKQTISVTKHDAHILTSNVNFNIRNTASN